MARVFTSAATVAYTSDTIADALENAFRSIENLDEKTLEKIGLCWKKS